MPIGEMREYLTWEINLVNNMAKDDDRAARAQEIELRIGRRTPLVGKSFVVIA